MALSGKLEIEIEVKTPADKIFNIFSKELHHFQNNITDHVHEGEVHEGDDWHSVGSVKAWTYTIDGKVVFFFFWPEDGKVVKCKERIEVYDEENKTITFDLFEGDVTEHYKSFKLTLKVYEKDANSAIAKWIVDYEKVNEEIPPPNGYIAYVTYITKDAEVHLLKA